jgi:predicted amidohydrolase YtcJ
VPDLLVVAPVVTCDPARPRAEAALVRGGVFVRVGSRRECERDAGRGALRIEAGGAVPGLADAHGHVALLGRWRGEVACAGAGSADACAARAAERAREVPPGTWIRGNGWDQNRWSGGRFPTADALTRAVPRHPAALPRVDAHAIWVNAAALAAAGIDARTPDPAGGRILRDERGQPSGVLLDAAQDLVLDRIPPPGPRELEEALLRGLGELVRRGITSVHDAGVPEDVLAVYRRLAAEDRLPLRGYAMLDGERPAAEIADAIARAREWEQARRGRAGARPPPGALGADRLTVRAVKLFADGALGSRGAALHEDYADEPGNRGLLLTAPESLAARVAAVCAAGFQPAVHAIGDRALTVVLDALDAASGGADICALRPRIEHLQIVLPRHLPRLVRLGAVASVQPLHLAADAAWAPARLGAGTERLRGAYAFRTLRDAGVPLAFGSDFPVVDPEPLAGLAAAESRASLDGPVLSSEERLGRAEALAAFTTGAAYAAFAERRRGMVREGMDADLTLLDGDVGAGTVDELRALAVTHTIVGGRVEHGAG